jgi:hypothetical protein
MLIRTLNEKYQLGNVGQSENDITRNFSDLVAGRDSKNIQ